MGEALFIDPEPVRELARFLRRTAGETYDLAHRIKAAGTLAKFETFAPAEMARFAADLEHNAAVLDGKAADTEWRMPTKVSAVSWPCGPMFCTWGRDDSPILLGQEIRELDAGVAGAALAVTRFLLPDGRYEMVVERNVSAVLPIPALRGASGILGEGERYVIEPDELDAFMDWIVWIDTPRDVATSPIPDFDPPDTPRIDLPKIGPIDPPDLPSIDLPNPRRAAEKALDWFMPRSWDPIARSDTAGLTAGLSTKLPILESLGTDVNAGVRVSVEHRDTGETVTIGLEVLAAASLLALLHQATDLGDVPTSVDADVSLSLVVDKGEQPRLEVETQVVVNDELTVTRLSVELDDPDFGGLAQDLINGNGARLVEDLEALILSMAPAGAVSYRTYQVHHDISDYELARWGDTTFTLVDEGFLQWQRR